MPPPRPHVRMQPLNPSPDNGKSAKWCLFLVSHPHPPISEGMQPISHPPTPSFKLGAHKEGRSDGGVWDGASQNRGQGRACSRYSLAGLRGGGLPGARMEASSPPLPLPQCCSAPFAQCWRAKTPPQTGDGGGLLKEQIVIATPLYSFSLSFFFF